MSHLSKEEFNSLCKACDYVLTMGDMTMERLSIPWLHVVRAHPVVNNKYLNVFNPSKVKDIYYAIHVVTYSYMKLILRLFSSCIKSCKSWYGLNNTKCDVVFVTHLLNESQAGLVYDFYFGDMPRVLREKKVSVALVFINHTNLNEEVLLKRWKEDGIVRVVLPKILDLSSEVSLYFNLVRESKRLKVAAGKISDKLASNIAIKSSYEILRSGAIDNYRRYFQISSLVKILSPKSVISTYEGHGWERVVFSASKDVDSNIKNIGYHHAIMFDNQYSIKRDLPRNCNPDYILTSGDNSRDILEKSKAIKRSKVITLGSSRFGSFPNNNRGSIKNTCLVLPEGFETESMTLFNFSLKCALENPNITFIWRLHPSIIFEDIKKNVCEKLPNNIVLSSGSLLDDISNSDFALYRGSTSIITAFSSESVIPIYLDIGENMSIDPLKDILIRHAISTQVQFKDIIKKRDTLMSKIKTNKYAKKYCNNHYAKLNISILEGII